MKSSNFSCVAAGLAALIGGCAAWSVATAHHSFAMFDQSKRVSLTGVVKEFQFTNPHSFIEVDVVPPEGGAPVDWSVELNSPNNLRREGWTRTSLKAGDAVTVVINPLKDGRKGGLFIYATLADGKVLGNPNQGRAGPVNAPGVQ